MIIKVAVLGIGSKNITSSIVKKTGLGNLANRLATDTHLADKLKNAGLVGTIALGDASVKAASPEAKGHRLKAFGKGAVEGAFSGALISGLDHAIDTLKIYGEKNLSSTLKG